MKYRKKRKELSTKQLLKENKIILILLKQELKLFANNELNNLIVADEMQSCV